MKGAILAFSIVLSLALPEAAPAHFNMLLTETPSVRRGEEATITYQWGHPFEHQLFSAPAPRSVSVRSPDGKVTDLTKTLERITLPVPSNKPVTGYRFRFTPSQRGDYVFGLSTAPIWMEEEQEFLEDHVKLVIHVQGQKGWDEALGSEFELLPLTRPYGLQPGMVFQTQVLRQGKGPVVPEQRVSYLVEIERYNSTAPADLPPDEQITRAVKTDSNGVATCTLTEPGWWCIAAQRESGTRKHDGKSYPVRQRAIHWVHVKGRTASFSPTK
jgi:cobalt/nickel transport protein